MHTETILRNIRRIIRALNLESKKIQKEHGLTMTQLLVLKHLRNSPEQQATQKALCESLTLSRSTVTGIIDRMEKKNLVERLPKKNDRRTNYIGLTKSSLELLNSIPDPIQERLVRNLSKATDRDQVMISESLNMLTHFLDIDNLEASPLLTNEELSENGDNRQENN